MSANAARHPCFKSPEGSSMTTTVCVFDFNRLEVYEAGALLVTLLAYPDASDEGQGHVHASLCTHALRARSEIELEWAIQPQPIKPIYTLREPARLQPRLASSRALSSRSDGRRAHGDRLSQRGAARRGTRASRRREAAVVTSTVGARSRRYFVYRPR